MCRYKSEGDQNGRSDCDSLRDDNELVHGINEKLREEIRTLRDEIRTLREERRWVPVGERLPEDEKWLDVACTWGETIGYYDGKQWRNMESETLDEVTHFRKRTPGPGGAA